MSEFQFIFGKGDSKDGRLGCLVTAEMRGINVDIMNMSKVSRELDYHPTISYLLQIYSATHQSKEGLCRLDSHASYNAPVGPNWPFIDTLGLSVSWLHDHRA